MHMAVHTETSVARSTPVDSIICSFIVRRSKPDEDAPYWCKNDDDKSNTSAMTLTLRPKAARLPVGTNVRYA